MAELNCLWGQISVDTVLGLDDKRWRELQYQYMIDMQMRLSALEKKASWQRILMGIPWLLVGGLLGFIATGKITL